MAPKDQIVAQPALHLTTDPLLHHSPGVYSISISGAQSEQKV